LVIDAAGHGVDTIRALALTGRRDGARALLRSRWNRQSVKRRRSVATPARVCATRPALDMLDNGSGRRAVNDESTSCLQCWRVMFA
jgi:hypothetical protein